MPFQPEFKKPMQQRSEMDYLEAANGVVNLGNGFQHFDNLNDLRLEDANDHFQGMRHLNNNSSNNLASTATTTSARASRDHLNSPDNKYGDFFNTSQHLQQQQNTKANSNSNNDFSLFGESNLKNYASMSQNGSVKPQQSYNAFQQYQQGEKSQVGGNTAATTTGQKSKQVNPQVNGGSSTQMGANQEEQKYKKLINALKSKPQDLEQILEEEEKMKVECDQKQVGGTSLSKIPSQIQLQNYSPTGESIKRVESNTSLNGAINNNNNNNGQTGTSDKNLQKIKGNVKNAYIKKISSLLNLQNQSTQQEPTQQENNQGGAKRQDNSDDSDDSRSKSYEQTKQEEGKKVMKNRESARNSRQRKKIYIELLEKKISSLTSQIEDQCGNIEKSQKEICKILDNHNHIKAFVQTRHDYLQKIGEMANADKPNTEQLGYILDSLRLRIGAQGTSRQKAISLYFRSIMKQFMQSTTPYLIYGYESNTSEDQEFNKCVEIFKKICKITDEQQVFRFLPHLKKFLESRQNFKQCYTSMKKIRKNAFKRQESVEKLLDGLSLLHPTQMGKFLKSLDKHRKSSEIRLHGKNMKEDTSSINYEFDPSIFSNQRITPPTVTIPTLPGNGIPSDKSQNKMHQFATMNNNQNYLTHNNGNTHPHHPSNNGMTNPIHSMNGAPQMSNAFMPMHPPYNQMLNPQSHQLGMEMVDEVHLQQQQQQQQHQIPVQQQHMDIHSLQKQVGLPPPYYYHQNPMHMPQPQQLLSTTVQKDHQGFQKAVFNPNTALQQALKPSSEADSYYLQQQQQQQQQFKKNFYNDPNNHSNIPF